MPHDSGVDESTFDQVKNDYKKNTMPSYIVEGEQPKLDEKIVFIRNQTNNSVMPVQMLRGHKNRVVIDGLPADINNYAFNYTDSEKWENPLEVIECLVTMHATFSVGITETEDSDAAEVAEP